MWGIEKGNLKYKVTFHFYEISYPLAKKACLDAGLNMRRVEVDSRWFPREPTYDFEKESRKIEERLERAKQVGEKTRFIELAGEINTKKTDRVVNRL